MGGDLETLIRQLSERVSIVPVPGGLKIELPDEDEREELAEAADEERVGQAEGQSFTIEYRDSKGRLSRRRVTAWHLTTNWDGIARMYARCHERKAMRSFRLDRVVRVIDVDGEEHKPPDRFFAEVFGMSPKLAAAREPVSERIREVLQPDIALLSAMIHADGHADLDEIGLALDHCAEECRRMDLEMDEACELRLRRFLLRSRPTTRQIERALERMCREPDRAVRIIAAASAIMEADGRLMKSEQRLLDDMLRAVGAA